MGAVGRLGLVEAIFRIFETISMPTNSFLRILAWIKLGCVAAVLSGCASIDVPHADNYPASSQKKARAVHHWDVLADDVAQRVSDKLGATASPQSAVYVVPVPDTAFREGFRELLMTRLLDRGVRVATAAEGALRLQIGTQVVQHSVHPNLNNPVPWTSLALGVVVLRDMALFRRSNQSATLGILGVGAAADVAGLLRGNRAAGGLTGLEVLVSTALQDQGQYLARTADVYYIEQADIALYRPEPPASPPPAPTPVKTWKVVDR